MRRAVLPAAATVVALTASAALAAPPPLAGPPGDVTLDQLGTYATGEFDESAAEIVAHDPGTQTLFVVNANAGRLDLLDVSDPTTPTKVGDVESSLPGGVANSVAVAKGVVAVAVAAPDRTDPGVVEVYEADALVAGDTDPLAVLTVGANPDMATFTPNGRTLLVANEGEPSDDYLTDPVGSISIVDIPGKLGKLDQGDVRTAGFEAFDEVDGVRVFGPEASFAQDMEPEYIAVSQDGRRAYVALQENNALATVDIRTTTVTDVVPLGFKDHLEPGNELDPSDDDGEIAIEPWPLLGMYLPDSIAGYRVKGQDLVVTANEGDAREYVFENEDGDEIDAFIEEERVDDLELCEDAFAGFIASRSDIADLDELQDDENLGRKNVTTTLGQRDGEDCYEELYAFGARSFSIFTPDGELVYDSGSDFESVIAGLIDDGELPPFAFNANNDENAQDVVDEDGGNLADVLATPSESRSDNKGPEPEGIALGRIGSQTFAFIGLERVGGIMVYNITDPTDVAFVDYVTTRDFGPNADAAQAGDLGPEGLAFIAANDSPTGTPLLAVGHEVSGTTTIFEVVPATD